MGFGEKSMGTDELRAEVADVKILKESRLGMKFGGGWWETR
jgi:hypothetical protein